MAAEKSAEAFRTISEVADELQVPQHVLRFWEGRFPQIKPMKRAGGRRYYRPADVALLLQIRDMLYQQGLTIKDVQAALKDGTIAATSAVEPDLPFEDEAMSADVETETPDLPAAPMFQPVLTVSPPAVPAQPPLFAPPEPVAKAASPLPPYPQPLPLVEEPTIPGLVPPPHQSPVSPEAREQLIDLLDELEQLRYLLLVKN